MSLEIGHLPPPVRPVIAPVRVPSQGFAMRVAPMSAPAPTDTVELSLPPSPPAEILDEIGAAADRAHELATQNRELHFRKDEKSGRVVVEVRDLEGTVIRTIPPSEALNVMAGGSL
jgi:flagellar protein FlaG